MVACCDVSQVDSGDAIDGNGMGHYVAVGKHDVYLHSTVM
jgi:hypothetical protein